LHGFTNIGGYRSSVDW